MTELIAGRYQPDAALGRGGMGVVHRVHDRMTGKVLALKQARLPSDRHRAIVAANFEREYHTLVQLAHPRIVEVYEYGIEAGNPYYTMELLEGSDLRKITPVSWRDACLLLRDVCSALALLHSRALVHRDVTPRNIRVAPDGRAKLFDFGAMAPFGRTQHAIGTPPFVAPETLRRRPLDGRSDLFSLGAVAYRILTGLHAFPAKELSSLELLWGNTPVRPVTFDPSIPEALDQLICDLLSVEPQARPGSAAEVMYRLAKIGDLPRAAELEVAQSYLVSPKMVGRLQERVRWREAIADRKRGQVLLISGRGGTGRSRALDQLAVDGKLAGRHVLQLDAAELPHEPFAGVRRLTCDLSEHVRFSDLKELAPEPADTDDGACSDTLVRTLRQIATCRPLLLLVDNAEKLDDGTSACLLELAALEAPLVIGIAFDPDRLTLHNEPVFATLANRGETLYLQGLSQAHTLELLHSVFGGANNLRAVAEWAQQVGEGRPKVTMELSQHLVDREIARFELGRWVLPDDLSDLALPDNVENVLRTRVDALSPAAREIGQTLALLMPFAIHAPRVEEYPALFESAMSHGEVFRGLDELLGSRMLTLQADRYAFTSDGHAQAFGDTLSEERKRALHARIGEHFIAQGEPLASLAIYHFHQAGCEQRTFEMVAVLRVAGESLDSPRVQLGRLPQGLALLNWALDYIETHDPPPAACAHVFSAALGLSAVADPRLARCAPRALARYIYDSGRDLFDDLDPTLPADQRLSQAFAAAQARWESAEGSSDRGLPPAQGIEQLAMAVASLTAANARMLDVQGMRSLEHLIDPFRPFPAIEIVYQVADMTIAWSHGTTAAQRRLHVLELADNPVPGISELVRHATITICNYHCGLADARDGRDQALRRADTLVGQRFYAALGWDVRACYYLNRGMVDDHTHAVEQRALAALRAGDADHQLSLGLVSQLVSTIHVDDLMGLNSMLRVLKKEAAAYPGWRPVYLYARGCRQLMIGDAPSALREFEAAHELAPIGSHPYCDLPVEGLLRTLLHLGATERAASCGARAEAELDARGLEPDYGRFLQTALALCEAATGRHTEARARMERRLQKEEHAQSRGLAVGSLHETLARIALVRGDFRAAAGHVRAMANEYGPHTHPGLLARIARLERLAAHAEWSRDDQPEAPPALDVAAEATCWETNPWARVGHLPDNPDRVKNALRRAARHVRADGAALFVRENGGFSLVERSGALDQAAAFEVAAALGQTHRTALESQTLSACSDEDLPVPASTALSLTVGGEKPYEALPLPMNDGEPDTVLVFPASPRLVRPRLDEVVTILATSLRPNN
ncbi:MAG: protein kinase [Myxococcales bacterium]|nr:protein kinase [Myxococcales bacterium]